MKPIEALSKLFEARDAIHFAHLNTNSFAEHKALGKFYESWTDLTDTFVETYQGKYGRINGSIEITANGSMDATKYLKELKQFVQLDMFTLINAGVDIDLENIIADMQQLINHTLYKLTLK